MEHAEKIARRKALLGMRIIGSFKLLTGLLLLGVALGLKHLLIPTQRAALKEFFEASRLDANFHFLHAAIEKIFAIPDRTVDALRIGAFVYAGLHLLEGFGLIFGQTWAEWLVIVNTGLFVPLEIQKLIKSPDLLHLTALLLNLAIMAYFIIRLVRQHRRHKVAQAAPPPAPIPPAPQ